MSRDFNDILREEGIEVARRLDATAVKYEPPKDNFGEKSFNYARGASLMTSYRKKPHRPGARRHWR